MTRMQVGFVVWLAAIPAQPQDPAGLEGTAWNAGEVAGTAGAGQPTGGNEPPLVFGAGGRLSGADGCNRLTGPYSLKGNGITFGAIAGTQMACEFEPIAAPQ